MFLLNNIFGLNDLNKDNIGRSGYDTDSGTGQNPERHKEEIANPFVI